jgi:HAD superfamily hydrolase (TIGR01549 family)
LATSAGKPPGILFDLFGTLVAFDASRLPRVVVGGSARIVTIDGLEDLLAQLSRQVSREAFFEAIDRVSAALRSEVERTHREIHTQERFRRTLAALGVQDEGDRAADELARRHMHGLASAVVCPPGREELLAALGRVHRLALVSNFDHAPTARAILQRHALDRHFEAILISDEVGIRKPSAEIFREACRRLRLAPAECVHVGDSPADDVAGAVDAGLLAVWVRSASAPGAMHAVATVGDVDELPACLENLVRSGEL